MFAHFGLPLSFSAARNRLDGLRFSASNVMPIVKLHLVSKVLQLNVSQSRTVFSDLSLAINRGDRLAIFSVDPEDAASLVQCISGVELPDRGSVEHYGSSSWPIGTNQAFSGRLSGYANARFAAEIYSQPGCIETDLRLIQELTQVEDVVFHQPLSTWSGAMRESLRLAVSLAFDFDIISVAKISNWDFRSVHPHAMRIREIFEQRIDGRTLVMAAPGQNKLALEYCDEGVVLLDGSLTYRGDPEVCLELVKEVGKQRKLERRAQMKAHAQELLRQSQFSADEESDDEGDAAFA